MYGILHMDGDFDFYFLTQLRPGTQHRLSVLIMGGSESAIRQCAADFLDSVALRVDYPDQQRKADQYLAWMREMADDLRSGRHTKMYDGNYDLEFEIEADGPEYCSIVLQAEEKQPARHIKCGECDHRYYYCDDDDKILFCPERDNVTPYDIRDECKSFIVKRNRSAIIL